MGEPDDDESRMEDIDMEDIDPFAEGVIAASLQVS